MKPRLSMKLLWKYALDHGEVYHKYLQEPTPRGTKKTSQVPHFLHFVQSEMKKN